MGLQMNELKLGSIAFAVEIHNRMRTVLYKLTTGDLDLRKRAALHST